jgi:cap1 methyltransferase
MIIFYSKFILFFTDTGVGGVEGNGDIFNPDNQAAFIQFVKDNTDGKGVHFAAMTKCTPFPSVCY